MAGPTSETPGLEVDTVPADSASLHDHAPASQAQMTPENGLGCLLGLVGVCLIFALPRAALSLCILGFVVMLLPGYLLLPIGNPKDPETGHLQARPSYSPGARLAVAAFAGVMLLIGFAGLKRDIRGVAAPPPAKETDRVSALQEKRLETPTVLALTKEVLSNATDRERAEAYRLRGELWILPEGTRVNVTDRGLASSKVLVLDGSSAGREGYVVSESVRI